MIIQRYKATIAYDGSGFSGFQIQPEGRTVQGEIEKVLKNMHKGEEIRITASGRTDAGVHARGQVFHFDSPLEIPLASWEKALNAQLPKDIVVLNIEKVPSNFHARFDAIGKTYKYFVYTGNKRDPFRRNFMAHYPYAIQLEPIKQAIPFLIGTHDFTSFSSAKAEVENKVRTIHSIDIEEKEDQIIFTFFGNGFLYNMVRIIVGTLMEVGAGKRNPDDINNILKAKDRQMAGKTAPPEGLYLWSVSYPSTEK